MSASETVICPTCQGCGFYWWPDFPDGSAQAHCLWCEYDIEMVKDGWDHTYRNDPFHSLKIDKAHVPTPTACPTCNRTRRVPIEIAP